MVPLARIPVNKCFINQTFKEKMRELKSHTNFIIVSILLTWVDLLDISNPNLFFMNYTRKGFVVENKCPKLLHITKKMLFFMLARSIIG